MATSLRNIFRKEIKQKCPELLKKEKSFWDYVADKYIALGIVVPIYFSLYLLAFLFSPPDFLNLITLKDAQELNNSSNGVLASIVGITMVIIGFIFTEIKSKSFVNFKFFSEKTFIFPIFYSSLANIVGMLITSVLSDTIDNIGNAVLLGHYLIVLVNIPLIVVIFIRVAKYMDYQPVFDSYKSMILKKANSILFQEKLIEFFSKSITKILENNSIKPSYLIGPKYNSSELVLRANNPKGMFYDILIDKFEKDILYLKKRHPTESFLYYPFVVGRTIDKNTSIIFTDKDSNVKLKKTKSLITKSVNEEDETNTYKTLIGDIHQQYIEAVRNNNANQSRDYLKLYKELNELYCATNKSLR